MRSRTPAAYTFPRSFSLSCAGRRQRQQVHRHPLSLEKMNSSGCVKYAKRTPPSHAAAMCVRAAVRLRHCRIDAPSRLFGMWPSCRVCGCACSARTQTTPLPLQHLSLLRAPLKRQYFNDSAVSFCAATAENRLLGCRCGPARRAITRARAPPRSARPALRSGRRSGGAARAHTMAIASFLCTAADVRRCVLHATRIRLHAVPSAKAGTMCGGSCARPAWRRRPPCSARTPSPHLTAAAVSQIVHKKQSLTFGSTLQATSCATHAGFCTRKLST